MITYTIAMPAPHSHLFHVSVEFDGLSGPHLDLILPSWTPGSYMIREYARHVQAFAAQADGGAPLPWRKLAKDTWRVETGGAARVVARYQVYANDLTVRTSHLDGTHGYFNGATVFMYAPGRTAERLRLIVEPPPGWRVTTGLAPIAGDAMVAEPRPERHLFVAADYDELVDCPVECGQHRLLTFAVDGVPHELAIWGRGNADEARLLADTRRIVEVQRDFFGGLPYGRYSFILHLTDGRGGGLEHRNSVTNQVDRWSFRPERSYERYLSLTSHELFHVWNVKRLRPAPLGPFDYRAENYTRLLWLAEGATTYYDELLLVRAGLMRPERYLERLADEIVSLQSQPGRRLQSLEQSSFDAWIKLYRPDENSANSSISYYLKGGLVCLLLDMEIRLHTSGKRSLDDVLRLLYARYPLVGPGIPEEGAVLDAVVEVAGEAEGAFREFFARYIAGVDELDYASGLTVVGLEPRWSRRGPRAWLGLSVRRQGERTIIAAVRSDGPAYAAGVYPDDELLAIDGWRADGEKLNARLGERAPGATVRLALFRGDALVEVPVTLAEAPADALELAPVAERSEAQARAYRLWLGLK
ncbi:MAG TPA: PDZ domain-containing protein [Chloroflexaceae bacterium]|nr:PDZ domain-containing protein [Chloroflexaceae bacterium]